MQEHQTNSLQSNSLKSLLAEVANASKRFFWPLQNMKDSVTLSKTLIANSRNALHALIRDNFNASPQSHVSPRSVREGSSPSSRDRTSAQIGPLKYDPLRDYLLQQHLREIELTFDQIEEILGGVRLPKSAELPQWWANQLATGSSAARGLRAAGYDAFLIAGARKVKFRRVP